MKLRVVVAFLVAAALHAAAWAEPPQPELLYDLDSTSPAPDGGPYAENSPARFTPAGRHALFVVRRVAAPRVEVWSTDGTAAGTQPLAVFCEGSYCTEPVRMMPAAGTVALFAGDGALWRSDGTRAGTFPLPTSGRTSGDSVALPGGRVLFATSDGNRGELWRTDGTAAGTRRVADVAMGWTRMLAGDLAFFSGRRNGRSFLWRSDGTEAGTVPLRRFASIQSIVASGRSVFFIAGDYQSSLWLSDGTVAGTRRLASVAGCSDRNGCSTRVLGVLGQFLYFAHSNKLWRADAVTGTVVALAEMNVNQAVVSGGRLYFSFFSRNGAFAVASIGPGEERARALDGCTDGCPGSLSWTPLAALPDDGRILVGVHTAADRLEVWAAGGGTAPTTLFTLPGDDRRLFGLSTRSFGGRTLVGLSTDRGSELWSTDGTSAGTQRLADTGNGGLDLALAGDRAVFGGYDEEAGFQLWSTDGTPAGSDRLLILEARGAGSQSRAFAAVAGGVAFRACDGRRTVLWASDGVPGHAPTPLLDERDGCAPLLGESVPLHVDGRIFFTEPDTPAGPGVRQLWTSDGTPGGTAPLTSFSDQLAGEPFVLGGKVSFVVQPLAAGGASLWQTDGTAGGTAERMAFPSALSDLRAATPIGEELYFAAVDSTAGLHLFASAASSGETRRLTAAGPQPLDATYGIPFYPPRFTRFGDHVYFTMCARWPGPCGLMRTRGSVESTELFIGDPWIAYEHQSPLLVFRDRLVFEGDDGLASTDGSATGTTVLTAMSLDTLVVLGNRLFFYARDDQHGRELWTSDGTAAGTRLFVELAPGPRTFLPQRLVAGGGRLWLIAADPAYGRELWTVDPATGSGAVVDVAPGAMSSSPSDLAAVGERLLFTADDGEGGREPWIVPLQP